MEYKEIKGDLFTAPKEYKLAHCISADAKMGAGIAVEFKRHFKLGYLEERAKSKTLMVGQCYWVDRALNLVTKQKYWQKPTYMSLRNSLESMRNTCKDQGIFQVAMPRIGSGLDKLQWSKVNEIIKEVFEETPMEIVVYYQ